MKINNLTTGFLFAFCIGCGAPEDTTNFKELGSAQAELEKCYDVMSVHSCNFEAGIYSDTIRSSVKFEDNCKDKQKAVTIACRTQFENFRNGSPTVKRITSFFDDCRKHYQPQVEEACAKLKN